MSAQRVGELLPSIWREPAPSQLRKRRAQANGNRRSTRRPPQSAAARARAQLDASRAPARGSHTIPELVARLEQLGGMVARRFEAPKTDDFMKRARALEMYVEDVRSAAEELDQLTRKLASWLREEAHPA